MQTCASGVSVNDTLYITAGSANWVQDNSHTASKSAVQVPDNKNLTIIGAGTGSTIITLTTCASSPALDMGKGNLRVTNMQFVIPNGCDAVRIDGDGWRVDHITVSCTDPSVGTGLVNGVHARGLRTSGAPNGPTGLVDHVNFTNSRLLVIGYPDVAWNAGFLWSSDSTFGGAGAVYLEDSTVIKTVASANLTDSDYGGRYVARFNTFSGSSIDSHGTQQDFISPRSWEVYQNTLAFNLPFFTPVFIRGGTGMIWGNTIGGGWSEPYISFDVRRAFETNPTFYGAVMGKCDGLSYVDSNVISNGSSGQGWACRGQIGRGKNAFEWTVQGTAPSEASDPAYLWSNTIGGSAATVNIRNGTAAWIVADRDYYNHAGGTQSSPTSPFNGTTGVGVGTLANRPTTCTTGVGYWATDGGTNWNVANGSGNDGSLYKCTSTDTWTLYYTPYTYPHPLQNYVAGIGGGIDLGSTTPSPSGTVEVAAPTNPPQAPRHLRLVGR